MKLSKKCNEILENAEKRVKEFLDNFKIKSYSD